MQCQLGINIKHKNCPFSGEIIAVKTGCPYKLHKALSKRYESCETAARVVGGSNYAESMGFSNTLEVRLGLYVSCPSQEISEDGNKNVWRVSMV